MTVSDEQRQGNGNEEIVERGKWGHQIEFFLSLLGYSVGIGNLVRFPYLCYANGGGAFVIPFFLAHLFCGIPLFIMELILGQFSGLSPFTLWKFCPIFKGIGYSMAAISCVLSLYYNMLMAYCLFYLISSFSSELPWQSCNNSWNSPNCWDASSPIRNPTHLFNDTQLGVNVTDMTSINQTAIANGISNETIWASDEFFHRRVLGVSSSFEEIGGFQWELVGCFFASWCIVFFTLGWGVKWTGKVVYVTATLPYFLLTALVIRGCTMEGATTGLKYYLLPNFEKLLDVNTWSQACVQMFYSLGPAWGGLITMSSFNPFRHNCRREGILAPSFDMCTSLYGGVAIFSVLGYMAAQADIPIDKISGANGPGLAFIVYPLALSKLPGGPVWSVIFFLTLMTLGIDSMFGTFETVISGILDAWPRLRKYNAIVVGVCCSVLFVCGLVFCTNGGIYYYQFVDWYAATFTAPIIALSEAIAVFYIYGMYRFSADIELMLGTPPSIVLKLLWLIATPIVLILVLFIAVLSWKPPVYGDYAYPYYVQYWGLLLSVSTALPIPVTAIWVLYSAEPDKHSNPDASVFSKVIYNIRSRLRIATTPSDQWLPQDPEARQRFKKLRYEWKEFVKPEETPMNYYA